MESWEIPSWIKCMRSCTIFPHYFHWTGCFPTHGVKINNAHGMPHDWKRGVSVVPWRLVFWLKGQVKTYDPEPQGMVPALIRPGLRHLPFLSLCYFHDFRMDDGGWCPRSRGYVWPKDKQVATVTDKSCLWTLADCHCVLPEDNLEFIRLSWINI